MPSSALEGLAEPGERSPAFAGLAGQQIGVSPRPANVLQRIADFFSKIPGPGASPQQIAAPFMGIRGPGYDFLGGTQTTSQTTQADLPSATGEQATGFDAALAESRKRAAEFSDPMNTIEAAAGHVMVSFENGYSPPFIMYEVQSHWGWTDAQMKAAGYVRGLGGWTLDVGSGDVATSTAGYGDGGGGQSWSFPSLGGGGSSRNSFAGSSLINWRI